MKRIKLLIVALSFYPLLFFAQDITLPLWEGTPPNYKETNEKEIIEYSEITRISNVQRPDIAVFLPTKRFATGQAVVICPGGGYHILAYDHEGTDIAKFFNSKGIAAFVLKYRLPVSNNNIEPHKTPLLDAQRAMRMVRYHAEEWNINPNQVGIMGFSAGGHLASTLSTHYDLGDSSSTDPVENQSCRPDFSLLIYPVISFTGEFSHSGSRGALLGYENPDEELVLYYSNELQVTDDTPPAVLIHAGDDAGVPVRNSIVYYEALLREGIAAGMHIFPYGGHGFGLATGMGPLSKWPDLCVDFIQTISKDE